MLPQSTFSVRLQVASVRRKSLQVYPKYKSYHYEPITKSEIKPYQQFTNGKVTNKSPATVSSLDFSDVLQIPYAASPNHTGPSWDLKIGVILGYFKEIVLDPKDQSPRDTSSGNYSDQCYEMIEEWKEGTLKTLRMLEPGDFLAVKLTGAGPISVDAMAARRPMSEVVAKAVGKICVATAQQGSRLWLDAEQRVLQPGLDKWAIEMMLTHNRSETLVVYNTIQGYFKGSKANVDNHIKLAAQERWSLGIKLVRRAYIEHENCALIHDTKEETDLSYGMIADMLLCRRLPAKAENLQFPAAALFLATHNAASTAKAITTHQERLLEG
ncbi:hypothetical protein RU639_001859 [Aspergillus parasiticus]